MSLPIFDLSPKKEKKQCKGLNFRCKSSVFISSHNSIEQRLSLTLLKRKSCNPDHCEKCSNEMDILREDLEYNSDDKFVNLEDGKMYKLKITINPGTYEYPNDVDVEVNFEEVKE